MCVYLAFMVRLIDISDQKIVLLASTALIIQTLASLAILTSKSRSIWAILDTSYDAVEWILGAPLLQFAG